MLCQPGTTVPGFGGAERTDAGPDGIILKEPFGKLGINSATAWRRHPSSGRPGDSRCEPVTIGLAKCPNVITLVITFGYENLELQI